MKALRSYFLSSIRILGLGVALFLFSFVAVIDFAQADGVINSQAVGVLKSTIGQYRVGTCGYPNAKAAVVSAISADTYSIKFLQDASSSGDQGSSKQLVSEFVIYAKDIEDMGPDAQLRIEVKSSSFVVYNQYFSKSAEKDALQYEIRLARSATGGRLQFSAKSEEGELKCTLYRNLK